MGIYRRGLSNLLDFMITRDVIPTYSIDISFMPESSIGYIKLSKFSATTYNEFKAAVTELKGKGMNKLILDLRDNAGGYLQAAIDISDEFLDKDKLMFIPLVKTNRKNRFLLPLKETWKTIL